MKILLAIDDSKFSEAALRMILSQNRPRDTTVLVLHVVTPVGTFVPPDLALVSATDWDKIRKRQLQIAQKLVERIKERLRAKGFPADSAVVEGNARAEIVGRAAKWKADLIVVGSHGLKGLNRLLLGSVSEYVVRHARCSVQVVRLSKNKAA